MLSVKIGGRIMITSDAMEAVIEWYQNKAIEDAAKDIFDHGMSEEDFKYIQKTPEDIKEKVRLKVKKMTDELKGG